MSSGQPKTSLGRTTLLSALAELALALFLGYKSPILGFSMCVRVTQTILYGDDDTAHGRRVTP